ncbi:MAG: ArsR/SmtB family transcription factor [Hyphomicrobiaceae bacterium]
MEINSTIETLSALAQPTRLEAFRTLVRHEPQGLAAGALAETLRVPANTLSAHLGILARAGLITSQREGRSIVYRAELERLRAVISFLLKDCCQGRPEICAPLLTELDSCCTTAGASR